MVGDMSAASMCIDGFCVATADVMAPVPAPMELEDRGGEIVSELEEAGCCGVGCEAYVGGVCWCCAWVGYLVAGGGRLCHCGDVRM